MANGFFLGGVAKGLQLQEQQDQQNRELGIREKLAQTEGDKAKQAQLKDLLDRTTTNFKDIIASGKAIKQNSADPTQAQKALGILRNRITTTGAMLSAIPGGTAAAQSALDQFDADVLGTPTAVEAGKTKGQATAAEVTAAQPAQTAAKVAETTALGPVQAQNAAQAAAATTGAQLMTQANFADQTAAAKEKIAAAEERGKQSATGVKPQSEPGKLVADRLSFVNQYGEGSPQVKAFDEAASTAAAPDFKNVSNLRKEFTQQSNTFVTTRDAFSKVAAAAKDVSAAGDLSMIFAFMKMLDPTSVVREGEQASAANAAGVPDRIRAQYNRILSGERLADTQRADFAHQAENIFRIQLGNQVRLEDQYKRIAEGRKFDPSEALIDFIGPYRNAIGGGQTASAGGAAGVPKLGLDGSLQ